MQHVGESFLLPLFLLSLLPCLLFLLASSLFLPGSEAAQEQTDRHLTGWFACHAQLVPPRAPQPGLCYPGAAARAPPAPALEGDSRPGGLGAPSPSRCGSAAALPAPLAASPAEGEDIGLGTPGNQRPLCPHGHIPHPKSAESPKGRSAAARSPTGACGPVTLGEGASPGGTAASQQPARGLPSTGAKPSGSDLRPCLAGTQDVSGLAVGKGSRLCAR